MKKKRVCKKQVERVPKWVTHYCSDHKILLVGEGDFSFSLSLAQSFGSSSNIVASSLDSYVFTQGIGLRTLVKKTHILLSLLVCFENDMKGVYLCKDFNFFYLLPFVTFQESN
ncbi:hypothetical protein Lalb_Chr15g0082421 [Lupinus albus]|uniref:25S rRNA (uridine-N(3))-methyltransferase BMT5-like domain-containing protein n=1 Tax=Lupinus albus TaxID=3870 RepID=A0A6A4P999_LUPAL|nr:hypothetical protein Lalb_Chr15g0082421 [Lupinus albus]